MIKVDQTYSHRDYIDRMWPCKKMRLDARTATDRAQRLLVGMLCLTIVSGMARAGEIYKSVDANGNVVYSDHVDPSMTHATEVQLEDPGFPPHELHFCWTNCFTLVLDNDAYRRIDGTDESWTVETFSAKAIVLHRHDAPVDWNGYSKDVVYAGRMANDRLIDVTVNGKPTSGVDASWGSALNTLPGSNTERDATGTPNSASPTPAVSSETPPPPVVQEDQPPLSEDGTLWTPGYWFWRDQRYVWVRGTWARPPQFGLLWTPGYWSPAGSAFVFHPGHWGSTVGFYGGVNYGYGYVGNGYVGGHWIGNSFAYNSTVNHVNPAVAHHAYAESTASQTRVGYSRSSTEQRSADTARVPAHPVATRELNKPVLATSVQRSSEQAPGSAEGNKPAAVVRTPTLRAPPKSNYRPASAAPVK